MCPGHDLWTGDAHWVGRMPYGGAGETPDFWAGPPDGYPSPLLDAFPDARDDVSAMACDPAGRLWIGSYGGGLLRLDTTLLTRRYFDALGALPQDLVTAVAVDPDGSIWVGTSWGGVARHRPDEDRWTYHDETAGLPSDAITAFAVDARAAPRVVYIAHSRGLSAYRGP